MLVNMSSSPSKVVLHVLAFCIYLKVPKFWDIRNLCCNLPRIQTKSQNLTVLSQEDANGIANSEDPDQTAPLGAV